MQKVNLHAKDAKEKETEKEKEKEKYSLYRERVFLQILFFLFISQERTAAWAQTQKNADHFYFSPGLFHFPSCKLRRISVYCTIIMRTSEVVYYGTDFRP